MANDLKGNLSALRQAHRQASSPRRNQTGAGGGGSGGGSDLEKRIDSIETVLPDIRERLSRFEATLEGVKEQMITKADLAGFRVGMLEETAGLNLSIAHFRTGLQSMEARLMKWFVATAGVLSAIAFGVARLVH